MAQMQDLLAKSFRDFREGSIVKGRVLEIRPREVLVDIGYKSEGVIPSAEFDNIDTLEVGEEVDVLLERLENDEDRKSTRLNSSHVKISYAVFCLKKKKNRNPA